jgi:AraC-like DNA-binding protein
LVYIYLTKVKTMELNQGTDSEFLRKITEIILANLADEQFGGLELAREAGISRTNLNRKLNAVANQSANRLIREIRLQKALEMLQKNEGMVFEISYRVGFSSLAHRRPPRQAYPVSAIHQGICRCLRSLK